MSLKKLTTYAALAILAFFVQQVGVAYLSLTRKGACENTLYLVYIEMEAAGTATPDDTTIIQTVETFCENAGNGGKLDFY